MTISQGLVKVVFGNKVTGATGHDWFRVTRRNLDSLASSLSSLPNFYYAKVYHYKRLGKNKGIPITPHFAYIHWDKDGFLSVKMN